MAAMAAPAARPLEVVPLGLGLYRVRSESRPGIWYDVVLAANPDGPGWCSCPDFEYRGRERECKHIRAARRAALMTTLEREEVAAHA
jgi:hypothetical protein